MTGPILGSGFNLTYPDKRCVTFVSVARNGSRHGRDGTATHATAAPDFHLTFNTFFAAADGISELGILD
jgi:hypothetical protein